jgi:hypothetical protein
MARWTPASAAYGVADLFRQRCLLDQTSLLWPGKHAWTIENIDALWEAFIGRPDEGKRPFFEKWRDQLADQSLDVHRVAADTMAFYYLFPSNMRASAKSEAVQEVVAWKLAAEGDPPELDLLNAAFANGIGHSGIYYLTGRPWQVAYYLQFARRLLAESIDPRDPETCQLLADEVLGDVPSAISARHVLLHLPLPRSLRTDRQ